MFPLAAALVVVMEHWRVDWKDRLTAAVKVASWGHLKVDCLEILSVHMTAGSWDLLSVEPTDAMWGKCLGTRLVGSKVVTLG